MPTLRQYRREMFNRTPGDLGRLETIASLPAAGLTMTVSALATGTVNAGKFINKWLVRSDAAAAERVRICSNFAAATGTLTHAGTAYTDLTATDESVEILEFEPYLYDRAINQILHMLRKLDSEIVPTNGTGRYHLGDLSWLVDPGDVTNVFHSTSPIISRNPDFEKWNSIDSAGVLVPDNWTLAATGGSFARESTIKETGDYALRVITGGGNVGTVTQTFWPWAGVSANSLRGLTVVAYGVGRASVASSLRLRITDGVSTTDTDYHAGNGAFAELSGTLSVAATARTLTVSARFEQNDTAYLDRLMVVYSQLTDDVRRNDFSRWPIPNRIDSGPLVLRTGGFYSVGQQIQVESQRPYFLPTTSLSADGDNCDAPLIIVAEGACWKLYESLGPEFAARAVYHRDNYYKMAAQHMGDFGNREMGIPLPQFALGPAPMRWRA